MKYLVMLCDGMADRPVESLGNKTPMQAAHKPMMDMLVKSAEVGTVKTVADGLKPGSDVANLSVMGYDPLFCYTGRSPLEALSIGIDMKDTDVALRCNLVTLSDESDYSKKTMVDYCGGDISTDEAKQLIDAVNDAFANDTYKFYAGVAYRHCLIVSNGTTKLGTMTPPHDISGRVIGEYLSTAETAKPLIDMMKKSYDILSVHPVNLKRVREGKRPANSIWLWGEGTRPSLQNFKEKFGVRCGVVSAVDLLKGIGKGAGMDVPEVAGATGYIDTDFSGKVAAAEKLYTDGCDLVYMHVEAPDECGHRGEVANKVKAIELIDSNVLTPLIHFLEKYYHDFRVLVMPDHPTPLDIRTHTNSPVPFMIYDSTKKYAGADIFSEKAAEATGNFVEFGPSMMLKLLEKE